MKCKTEKKIDGDGVSEPIIVSKGKFNSELKQEDVRTLSQKLIFRKLHQHSKIS